MRVVSTVHKAGWDAYGSDFQRTVRHYWDQGNGLDCRIYTEGFYLTGHPQTEEVERLAAFKAQYAHYKPPTWTTDVVRWSNKVFANYDALRDYKGIGVWLDCDTVTLKPITEDFCRDLLKGTYMASFKRVGMATETGFVVRDCSHPLHIQYMDTWVKWLESGSFKTLSQWCDASTMDATTRLFERQGLETVSLSGDFEKDLSPMDHAPLKEFITHKKGARKWAS